MLNVATINAGNYQGRGVEYTNILFDSVRRNLPEGFEGTFTVFTDSPDGYDAGIIVKPLPHEGLIGWWNKLALFKPGVFNEGDRIVYFDLSAVITGRLDNLMNYAGEFAILRDFYRPDGLQSSVMAWEAGKCAEIWEEYVLRKTPQDIPGGDQTFIEFIKIQKAIRLQDVFPKMFASYKLLLGIPSDASVVICHGHPKPHECDGWMELVWKIGGLARAELDEICNTEIKYIHDNIRHAMTLPLPWFDYDYSHNDGQVCIVGGSPSLAEQIEHLRWRQEIKHQIWALNGSFDYLMNNGIKPTAHFIVDARLDNVQFVQNPQHDVKYYIASQCDPVIFKALEGYDVTVFHCHTEGVAELLKDVKDKTVALLGSGTTVGMKAALIAELLGYRTVHLFGMDSCYLGDQHHVYKQTMNDSDRIITAVYGDREFKLAPWMVGQAQDFMEFVMRFTGLVTVAGNGLLAHIASLGVPESAADTRAREIRSRVKEGAIGAEIGVFAAALSTRLLENSDINLIMVDSWTTHGDGQYADSGDFHATLTQDQQDAYFEMSQNRVKFANGRAKIIRKSSVEAAEEVPDSSLDFIFIDADHSYEGCKADIAAWSGKVKDGGLISGHDYKNTEYPCFGVEKAVDEFIAARGLSLELGDNFTWFAKKELHNGCR